MRRFPVVLSVALAACVARPTPDERVRKLDERFASADAVLVDLEFDGKLVADTMDPPAVRLRIEAQLMYLVGQLNGDRSVGRHDRLEESVTTFGAEPGVAGSWVFTYHAKLPVAWGSGAPPATYAIALPLRVGEADQVAFAEKYATTCTDPEGGVMGAADAGRMFLFYRPQRDGCALLPADVFRTTATIAKSTENTTGKFPEYHRVWDDDALDVVAVFGREFDDGRAGDGGVEAYTSFLAAAEKYVKSIALDPTASPIEATTPATDPLPTTRFSTTLAGGRRVRIDVAQIAAHLTEARSAFDDWYDARTPDADLIVYSGHAGLGSNARLLTKKGVFRAKKYVVMDINGCDTLAYLDKTLAERRAPLNPDDPAGTKYMDTISNVLGGYFRTGDETALHLVQALVDAARGTPKTYPQILDGIDETQIAVVTGEEDNEFVPGMLAPPPASVDGGANGGGADASTSAGTTPGDRPATAGTAEGGPSADAKSNDGSSSGCSTRPTLHRGGGAMAAILAAALAMLIRRRRRSAATAPA